MRKNFGAKPWTYPQPVFILAAYDENGTPNAMNAAWGGISEDKELSMCISEGHKTTANILARKAFTVSMATADQMVACDYVGIESGNKVTDKVVKAGWHTTKSEFIVLPLEKPCNIRRFRLSNPQTACTFPCFFPYGLKQGKDFYSPLTTLSSSRAELRFASLVEWA